jgi:hypothetical protein
LPQNKPKKITHPVTGEQFKKVQLALLARSLQNIDFQFDPTSRDGLVSLQADLLHLALQRKLSAPDASACSHAVRNLVNLVTDLDDLEEYKRKWEELRQEYEIARRNGLIPARTPPIEQ